jgi:hypothetical protein
MTNTHSSYHIANSFANLNGSFIHSIWGYHTASIRLFNAYRPLLGGGPSCFSKVEVNDALKKIEPIAKFEMGTYRPFRFARAIGQPQFLLRILFLTRRAEGSAIIMQLDAQRYLGA